MGGRVKAARGALSRNPLTHIGKALPRCCNRHRFLHREPNPAAAAEREGRTDARGRGQQAGQPPRCVKAELPPRLSHPPATPGHAQQTLPFASSYNTTLISHRKASPPSQAPAFVLVPWIWQAPLSASKYTAPERKQSHLEAVPALGIVNFARSSPPPDGAGVGSQHLSAPRTPTVSPSRPRAGSSLALYLHRHPARSGGYPTCTSAQAAPEPSAR